MLRQHDTAVLVSPIAHDLPDWKNVDWIGIDLGYKKILEAGQSCLFAIGDFDSGQLDDHLPFKLFRHPVAKDETDSQLAIAKASEMGYEHIILWGALEGRLDHTLANLRCIAWMYPTVVCMDTKQKVQILLAGSYAIKRGYKHVSFFALEPSVISLIGFEYPLDHARIDQKDFYTCSNAISNESAIVELEEGRVICVESNYQ
ncbi:thiamine diphosphokinase [Erysipelotrichaceae bacterium RD49]|nr:thiamine diphosphokinase [Erysipelotrichaceae bacterium RD49]